MQTRVIEIIPNRVGDYERIIDLKIDEGCVLADPCGGMCAVADGEVLALACLSELRLTNRGLVDCRTFSFVDLFVD